MIALSRHSFYLDASFYRRPLLARLWDVYA